MRTIIHELTFQLIKLWAYEISYSKLQIERRFAKFSKFDPNSTFCIQKVVQEIQLRNRSCKCTKIMCTSCRCLPFFHIWFYVTFNFLPTPHFILSHIHYSVQNFCAKFRPNVISPRSAIFTLAIRQFFCYS